MAELVDALDLGSSDASRESSSLSLGTKFQDKSHQRFAQVAELVDAPVSGTGGSHRGGSSPPLGTISKRHALACLFIDMAMARDDVR